MDFFTLSKVVAEIRIITRVVTLVPMLMPSSCKNVAAPEPVRQMKTIIFTFLFLME